jgi:ankyrin repeat protein
MALAILPDDNKGTTPMIRLPAILVFLGACSTAFAGPLHDAARSGDISAVRALIEGEADVNALQDGETPLALAAINGQALVVKVLAENGADVAPQGPDGATPLRRVIQRTDIDAPRVLEVVNVLLINGANPDHDTDQVGRTPLVWALLVADQRMPLVTAGILEDLLAAGAQCVAQIDDPAQGRLAMRALAEKVGIDALRVWDRHCSAAPATS